MTYKKGAPYRGCLFCGVMEAVDADERFPEIAAGILSGIDPKSVDKDTMLLMAAESWAIGLAKIIDAHRSLPEDFDLLVADDSKQFGYLQRHLDTAVRGYANVLGLGGDKDAQKSIQHNLMVNIQSFMTDMSADAHRARVIDVTASEACDESSSGNGERPGLPASLSLPIPSSEGSPA